MVKPRLEIQRCPVHPAFMSVAVQFDGHGTRLTPSKCCGQWTIVKSWNLDEDDWRAVIVEAERAIAMLAEPAKENS